MDFVQEAYNNEHSYAANPITNDCLTTMMDSFQEAYTNEHNYAADPIVNKSVTLKLDSGQDFYNNEHNYAARPIMNKSAISTSFDRDEVDTSTERFLDNTVVHAEAKRLKRNEYERKRRAELKQTKRPSQLEKEKQRSNARSKQYRMKKKRESLKKCLKIVYEGEDCEKPASQILNDSGFDFFNSSGFMREEEVQSKQERNVNTPQRNKKRSADTRRYQHLTDSGRSRRRASDLRRKRMLEPENFDVPNLGDQLNEEAELLQAAENNYPKVGTLTEDVAKGIKAFRLALDKFSHHTCDICHERFPDLHVIEKHRACRRCVSDNGIPKRFSKENNMDPGLAVPVELSLLYPVEEMLIAQVATIMTVHILPGGQVGYKGNVINFSQDVSGFAKTLPRLAKDLSIVLVKRPSANNSKQFRVRKKVVETALRWLQENNTYYRDVVISDEHLASLPDNDFIDQELRYIDAASLENEPQEKGPLNTVEDSVPADVTPELETFLPVFNRENTEDAAVESAIRECLSAAELNWPRIGKNPINEFEQEGYDVCAFPTLFPTGAGSIRAPRVRPIQPAEYFLHMMKYGNGRFRRHSRFRFFAFNSLQRWRALTTGNIFLKYRSPDDEQMTWEEFRDKYVSDPASLALRVTHFGKTLLGTKQYWMHVRSLLLQMVRQLGAPAIFFTLSSADIHWLECQKLMCDAFTEITAEQSTNYRQRVKNLINEPAVAEWAFCERVELFLKHVLMVLFDVKDYWIRWEWQVRGSPHVHGFLWIRGAPDVENMTSKTAEEKTRIAKWYDSISTECNPDEGKGLPAIHPCQIAPSLIVDSDDDYANLCNCVQRHTRCAVGYCWKKKKGGVYACRFGYPKDKRSETEILTDEKKRAKLFLKRNDDRMNRHNRVVLQTWRANVDVSGVVDSTDVLKYAAKYATKPEPRSQTAVQLLETILKDLKPGDHPRVAVQRLLLKTVGERDYTSQEVTHMLFGLPLVRCSRTFVKLFLFRQNNLRQIKRKLGVGGVTEVTETDNVQKYMGRSEDLETVCLKSIMINFAWNQKEKRWKQKPVGKENVLEVIPHVADNPYEEEYCRQRLMLEIPFRAVDDLVRNFDGSWVNAFAASDRFTEAEKFPDDFEASDDEFEDDDPPDVDQAEWMEAAAMGPAATTSEKEIDSSLGRRPIDLAYDWNEAFSKIPNVSHIHNFVEQSKQLFGDACPAISPVDPDTLNSDQRPPYEVIKRHKDTEDPVPIRLIVQGTAGTGKSHFIRAIMGALNSDDADRGDSPTAVLLAPTGVAAFLVNGSTIQSRLRIPPKCESMKKLSGDGLRALQRKWSKTKYLLIEERSMLGCRLFCAIDQRTRELFPEKSAEPFGGLSVIMIGDLFQLPPVGDRSVYLPSNSRSTNESHQNAFMLHSLFNRAAVFKIQQRQIGQDETSVLFREILWRLAHGNTTVDDFNVLMTRRFAVLSRESQQLFRNAIRLFATRREVQTYNLRSLEKLNRPVALINASHSCTAAKKADTDDAKGLPAELRISTGCRVMLKLNLWVSTGLVNGASGTVQFVVYEPDSRPPALPMAVIVRFDNYRGPSFQGFESCVPIEPVRKSWVDVDCAVFKADKQHKCSRTAVPIVQADAVTVHCSQGRTIDTAVVDIGEKEFAPGLTFVGTSRVRQLTDLAFGRSFDYKRIDFSKTRVLQDRLTEELRLDTLAKEILSAVVEPSRPPPLLEKPADLPPGHYGDPYGNRYQQGPAPAYEQRPPYGEQSRSTGYDQYQRPAQPPAQGAYDRGGYDRRTPPPHGQSYPPADPRGREYERGGAPPPQYDSYGSRQERRDQYPGGSRDDRYDSRGGASGGGGGGRYEERGAQSGTRYGQGGGQEPSGGVVMLYGLSMDKFNCDRLFNLFCLYGNVLRVKFLKSKEGSAMIQMGDTISMRRSLENLHGITVFGSKMQVTQSRQTSLNDVPNPYSLPDGTPSYKDFSNARNNRFATPEQAAKNRITAPTRCLHFFNAPAGSDEAEVEEVFVRATGRKPDTLIMMKGKSERSESGFVEYETLEAAAEALIMVNHTELPNKSTAKGAFPYIFKVCFTTPNAHMGGGGGGPRREGGGGGGGGGPHQGGNGGPPQHPPQRRNT